MIIQICSLAFLHYGNLSILVTMVKINVECHDCKCIKRHKTNIPQFLIYLKVCDVTSHLCFIGKAGIVVIYTCTDFRVLQPA